jgi:hypothetical protein
MTWAPLGQERRRPKIFWSCYSLIASEVSHRIKQLKDLGLLPSIMVDLLNVLQAPLEGDVLITPSIFCKDIKYLLANPDPSFIDYCIGKGENAAWKRIAQIKMRCIVEFSILNILKDLGQ